MRIDRLELRRFGPFEGTVLDLSAGDQGLHFIYGANEAGKSTLLRALKHLLFRFDGNIDDAWKFDKKDALRIAAALRRKSGATLHIVRRKGKKGDLRAANDSDIVEESTLQAFLGGIDKETFHSVYGIDAERLREGGRELLEGKGEAGATLFAARSGISGIQRIAAGFNQDAEALYKLRGRTQQFHVAKSELKKCLAEAAQRELHQEDWQAAKEAVEKAQRQSESIAADIARAAADVRRFERLRDLQPMIATRDRLAAEFALLADAPVLDGDFSERRVRLESEIASLLTRQEEIQIALAGIAAENDAFQVDDRLLARAADIESVRNNLSKHQKAESDKSRELGRLQGEIFSARSKLRALGFSDQLDSAALEALKPGLLAKLIPQLAQERGRLESARDEAESALNKARGKRADAMRLLAELPAFIDVAPLRAQLAAVRDLAPIERELIELERECNRLAAEAKRELAQWGGWSRPLSELIEWTPPPPETVERFEAELAEADRRNDAAQSAQRQANEALEAARHDLRVMQVGRETPSPAELQAARDSRERGWQCVRAAWLAGAEDKAAVQRFVQEHRGQGLPDAYENSVLNADALADRMREAADRVLEIEQKKLQIERLEAVRRRAAEDAALAAEAVARQTAAWRRLWQGIDVDVHSPREMLAWLRHRNEICALERRRQDLTTRRDDGARRAARASADLQAVLATLGVEDAGERTLVHWVARAESLLAECERVEADRAGFAARRSEAERDEAEANDKKTATAERLAAWSQSWMGAVARLGLPSDATIEQASDVVQQLQEQLAVLEKARGRQSRIEGIDRDAADERQVVSALVSAVAPELAGRPIDRAVAELERRLKDAERLRQHRGELEARARELENERSSCKVRVEGAQLQLAAMCRLANASDPAALPRIEQRAKRRAELEVQLRDVDGQLAASTAGFGGDGFAAEARRVDQQTLDVELSRLKMRLQELEQRRSETDQSLGGRRRDFEALESAAADANEARELAEQHLATLLASARQFALLRTAGLALQAGIERYRERNQTPVLERARTLFATVTRGAFSGLRVEFDDAEKPQLVALRGEATVPIAGLSDGAADQLFLALRLATIFTSLTDPEREPMPFVVDDLLLTFDDERAVAALHCLVELSARTQVLFLTHHRHLIDLARRHLDPAVAYFHDLAP